MFRTIIFLLLILFSISCSNSSYNENQLSEIKTLLNKLSVIDSKAFNKYREYLDFINKGTDAKDYKDFAMFFITKTEKSIIAQKEYKNVKNEIDNTYLSFKAESSIEKEIFQIKNSLESYCENMIKSLKIQPIVKKEIKKDEDIDFTILAAKSKEKAIAKMSELKKKLKIQ